MISDQSYGLLLLLDGSNAILQGCLVLSGYCCLWGYIQERKKSIMGYFSQFLGFKLPYMQKLWVLFWESRMLSPKDGLGSGWNVILS